MAHELQHSKFLRVISPVAIVDNTSWTTVEIDTLGYNYLTVVVNIGATDIAMAALKLQQSDTSGSGFADVTGLDSDGVATAAGYGDRVWLNNGEASFADSGQARPARSK